MRAGQRSLGEWRTRADAVTSESGLRRLAAELESDGRQGARALAARCRKRASAIAKEHRRMEGLFRLARELRAGGARCIAGVDEVGVGPLAGPVVAAAVVLNDEAELPGLDDSKRLTHEQRVELDLRIRAQARGVFVAEVWPEEIDRLNIYHAALQAMRRSVLGLAEMPDHVLVDARTIPDLSVAQTPLIGGDGRDASIAAASIVAKVHRDALMRRLDQDYPGYGFAKHKGYPTGDHLAALRRVGPCEIHRRSYGPVRQQLSSSS